MEKLLEKRRALSLERNKVDREIWEFLKKNRTKVDKKIYKVLKMHFHEKKSLEKIGKELGYTRGRIQQLKDLGVVILTN